MRCGYEFEMRDPKVEFWPGQAKQAEAGVGTDAGRVRPHSAGENWHQVEWYKVPALRDPACALVTAVQRSTSSTEQLHSTHDGGFFLLFIGRDLAYSSGYGYTIIFTGCCFPFFFFTVFIQ